VRRIQAVRWGAFLSLSIVVVGILWWSRSETRPNILLITLDTTRADRLGCYGYKLAGTPNLDVLANRGVLFERAYAPAPMTSPSHASIFTGLWPPEHGVFTNGQVSLDESLSTVAELLSGEGYNTAAFVAAFVLQEKFGFQQGFKFFDDDLSKAASDIDVLHQYRDGRYVIDSAMNWLERREAKKETLPFFCWVHLYDAHDPYINHPKEFGDKFSDRRYDGELAYVDMQVGRLLEKLKSSGLDENTIVVFVGDHGESLGEHGEETHGYMLHDSTLRVPLVIVDPNAEVDARRIQSPVTIVSLFPTLLEFAGVKNSSAQASLSLAAACRGSAIPSQLCYSQTDEPYLQAFWSPLRGLTTERWRYVRSTKPELYDLVADPRELVNLSETEPDLVIQLDGELAAFEDSLERRVGGKISLSRREEQALHSLGYTGGAVPEPDKAPTGEALPDIKDMIGFLNRLQKATDLIDTQDIEPAIKILEPLATEVPDFMRVHLNLALCYLQQGEFNKASHSCALALEIDPDSDRALDMAGFSYLKLQQLDKASQHFQRLIALQPDSENGHLFMGEIYQRQKQYDLAMRHYGEVLRINPGNSMARSAYTAIQQAMSRP
jgi:arylsulfatase A-like enzyme/Tfp pilus assembly protein PilF